MVAAESRPGRVETIQVPGWISLSKRLQNRSQRGISGEASYNVAALSLPLSPLPLPFSLSPTYPRNRRLSEVLRTGEYQFLIELGQRRPDASSIFRIVELSMVRTRHQCLRLGESPTRPDDDPAPCSASFQL